MSSGVWNNSGLRNENDMHRYRLLKNKRAKTNKINVLAQDKATLVSTSFWDSCEIANGQMISTTEVLVRSLV